MTKRTLRIPPWTLLLAACAAAPTAPAPAPEPAKPGEEVAGAFIEARGPA